MVRRWYLQGNEARGRRGRILKVNVYRGPSLFGRNPLSEERRYDDGEVAEILERATSEPTSPTEAHRALTPGEGLTLTDLQQIGNEVGIHPDRIADAARALEHGSATMTVERYLGATRAVSRTVQIDRALTEDEWAGLVADLRRTFNAKGKVEGHGVLRSWSNGNLLVAVEPHGAGYAVNMSTRKGNVTQFTLMGGMFALMGVAIVIGTLLGTDDSLARGALFAAFGIGQIVWVRARLPGWAELRSQQMEGLARRIPLMLKD